MITKERGHLRCPRIDTLISSWEPTGHGGEIGNVGHWKFSFHLGKQQVREVGQSEMYEEAADIRQFDLL